MTSPTLTDAQLRWLLRPVDPSRVSRTRGFAHLEAWDIRRHLTRVFGFGGFDTDHTATELVHQKETNPGRWTVVYRCTVRLTVRAKGTELGHWHGTATGAGINLSAPDAHDLALKAADSQALKRAATNLGDGFGLSLYNGGSLDPVVRATLVTGAQMPEKDTPVRSDPEEHPRGTPGEAEAVRPEPTPPADPDREKALDEMMHLAHCLSFSGIREQFESHFGHPISEGTADEFQQARDLMTGVR